MSEYSYKESPLVLCFGPDQQWENSSAPFMEVIMAAATYGSRQCCRNKTKFIIRQKKTDKKESTTSDSVL